MTGRLNEKVAVITGAGNGIGRATALRFAEEGAAVVVADIQDDKAHETAEMVNEAGGRAQSIAVDVTSGADNDAMADLALEAFGGLDCLVTAAGISHANYVSGDIEPDIKNIVTSRADYLERPGWEFVEGDPDSFDKVLNVNLKGTLLGMQSCAAKMLESGTQGSIVTVASIAAKHPDAGPVAYTVSKAGVWMLTKKAARMLGPVGIRVNCIGPGFISTHMTAIIDLMDESETDAFNEMIPLGRRGEPIEIANAALFLCSEESSYFTGEILHPDGGFFTE
ncbi:MAG: SDR family oxidoreductase [Acidimicrobiales bacterium]|jgi:NAD(P)-dependent dehydrogenase (short-subunit alcohol dehydrogenase family)|nr:SDR family oxidoreductase [Acidimicrobiales bacterium]MDP6298218.1 SDR family oxidoreductase [Acidimicrobiales bacterium]HJM29058.1 SDR family oxidoreductase [Acidimicrobiales bacterium]HJM97139.1 SDR family oxidoreductase [Acidimicrobiales bacterium]